MATEGRPNHYIVLFKDSLYEMSWTNMTQYFRAGKNTDTSPDPLDYGAKHLGDVDFHLTDKASPGTLAEMHTRLLHSITGAS